MKALLAIALLAAACGSFPTPSEDYECQRTRDCADGRVCRGGWCVAGGAPDGAPECGDCDDGDLCTDDSCGPDGTCRHPPVVDGTPCGGEGTCFSPATCQEGMCRGEPEPQGTECDDGLFCTDTDRCDGDGHCNGRKRDCSAAGGECTTGGCDEDADACVAVDEPDYTACSDGDLCTANDVCTGGDCGGVPTGGTLCPSCDGSCSTCDGGCCSIDYIFGCEGGPCSLDCTTSDCSCNYTCAGADCQGTCLEDCNVLCTSTAQCSLGCGAGALCLFDCQSADRCQMDCAAGAHCLLQCSDTDPCQPGNCEGDWADCGGGTYACGRPCP